jgi:flagellar basal-body rod protein FlgB
MRAIVTAQNIANGGTAGYRPLRVNFEDALAQAAVSGREAISATTPSISEVPFAVGQDQMRLDLELATASGTAGRYAALVEILNRHMQLDMAALTGGRGA